MPIAGAGTTTVDTVLVGGSLFTARLDSSPPGGVAVSGGRILAVGRDGELAPLVGPCTEVVDLAGGCSCPVSRTPSRTRTSPAAS